MMNNRVLHLNKDLQLIKILLKPDSETITAESDFLPRKVSVDRSGRVVLLAKGYNEGFLQFSSSGEFTGYVGANKVQYNPIDYFWRTIASDEQRAQMATFVPTEYNNMYIDNDSFIYCTTADFNSDQLLYGGTTPIRRINSLGADVLIRNGMTTPIGDISWSDTETIYGPSVLMDIAVLENETYFVLDRNRGRIFSYDSQGNMLYAFGGLGNKEGYFRYPSALELIGTDLLVCDEKTGAITVFKLTEFGSLINNALDEYNEGHYQESADYWKEVLALNGNYDLAYKGIGRALMLQGDYSEAMVYFKEKLYDKEYSQAYEMYRREWIEENIAIIVTIIGVLVASFIAFKVYKRIKKGVSYDDFN